MAINFTGDPGVVWIIYTTAEGVPESPDVYATKEVAVKAFSHIVRELGGDPDEIDFDAFFETIWHDHPDASESVYSVRMYQTAVRDSY